MEERHSACDDYVMRDQFDIRKAVDDPRWYALRTHPKQEDRVESNLLAWRVQTFCPRLKERRYKQFSSTPTYSIKHMFPGYIFARFDASRMLHKVSFTRGVRSVVSFGSGPFPIDDEIIDFIHSQVGEDGFVKIGQELKPGDKVVVKDGSFRGLVGIFKEKVNDKDRIRILLDAANYQGSAIVEKEQVMRFNPTLPSDVNLQAYSLPN